VGKRLAACVNIIPGITSIYSWKGSVQKDDELLLMIKSRESLVSQIVSDVRQNHPYDVPEVISVPIGGGNEAYMQWVAAETGDEEAP
jgi:periplasmic divalent cation tolerance protein